MIAGAAVSTARLQQRLRRVAVIEDRERIARDLHDAIIQDLFAVGLGLQGMAQRIGEPAVAGRLEDAVERLDLAIASLRRFIFDLKPSGEATLEEELRALCDRLAAPYGAEVDLELATPDPLPRGPHRRRAADGRRGGVECAPPLRRRQGGGAGRRGGGDASPSPWSITGWVSMCPRCGAARGCPI